jgi:FecR protein
MSTAHCRCLAFFLLTASLTAHASSADTATSPQPATTASPKTFDQIVRLSLVEGDVRISRGKESERATGGDWGQATTGLPVETGFSLATGKGRAAIEFEDTSTVYLGEDSVLTFNELASTGGVPHSNLTLVSGTATLNVQTMPSGEAFVLNTPVGRIAIPPGYHNFTRVNSYLDAMTISPQEGTATLFSGGSVQQRQQAAEGLTVTYYPDPAQAPKVSSGPDAFAEWDDWTKKRVAARNVAMVATMKEAGLASPIPGLAEMKDQGTFFACAPYGTCWEPTNGWGEHEAAPARVEAQQSSNPSQAQSTTSSPYTVSVKALQAAGPTAMLRTEYEEPFPCSPNRIRRVIARDPLTGKDTVLRTEIDPNSAPYYWAVCHAGTWIHREHRYVWVAGTKRHHICPVRWVKYGGTKGYVPMHPHDVAGKTPINLKHGVFETTGRKGESVERVAFNAGTPVKLLATAPKEFIKPYFSPLQHAETPHLEAHLVKDGFAPAKEGTTKPSGTAITFDHRSGSFQLARQVTQGGKNSTVTEHFGGRSNSFQARSEGGNFSSGNSGSRSAGNFSGSNHSSSNAGGGSHSSSGGGGSGGFHGSSGGGGGGGSHGGGGGGGGGSSGGGGGGGSSSGGGSHK